MIGFTIEPLMYNGDITTYRVTARRPDGSLFCDFGATRELAFQFGWAAMHGLDMRSPYAFGRVLDGRGMRRLPISFLPSEHDLTPAIRRA